MKPRYVRLNSQQLDDKTTDARKASFSDDNNEEIELGNGNRLMYHADDEDESIENRSPHSLPATNTSYIPGTKFMHLAIGTVLIILLYLVFSISLTFYNKALIKKFDLPFSIISYHLLIKYLLSAIIRGIYKIYAGKTRVQLDCRTSVRKMAPTGIASGIDIGFSTWGLELVSISLYTMTKSTTIVFILFFAILLGLEKKSWSLVLIVALIALGLFMMTYKSTQFSALGFTFLLVGSLSSGIRWSLAQFVMQKTKLGLHNPLDMIFHMQPWMLAAVVPFSLVLEGQKLLNVLDKIPTTSAADINWVIIKITFGALLAFCMEVTEFMVLSRTSGLTISIAGIFKDICQLALAVELNHDKLSLINVLGLIVCLAGICCHLLHKYSILTQQQDDLAFLENDAHFNETNINLNSDPESSRLQLGAVNNQTSISFQNSSQTVPLLEQTDTEDEDETNEQSASDVIFDVLKRRDMQR